MTEQDLITSFPWIAWRSPIRAGLIGDSPAPRLACRLCIAMKGMRADQIKEFPASEEDFSKHMAFTHNLIAVFPQDETCNH